MRQAILSVRMDENLKKQFDTLCNEFGMNTTTAITVFAKTVVRERKIPFEIAAQEDPFWSETNQAHLKQAIADIQAGKHTPHELIGDD
ncbi:MAG: type II toxin-antitoxin system RelB/DinJ family antitoxin [Treponema sp.]|jgi:DNA-damage-inducible protein J|nr:type II toxin-antitoxin system RelB/DinJ family antitoxin [Treponema sp.]